MSAVSNLNKIKVWDAPTRLFHWSLVCLVFFQFFTGYTHDLYWHVINGLAIFSLLLFRFLWGFFGSYTSKFSSFVKGFGKVFDYGLKILKNEKQEHIGHNPLGGWVILFMLFILSFQAITGIFSGFLSYMISQEHSILAWKLHKITAYILILTIITHISANFLYLIVRKENLIMPMITGYKKTKKDYKLKFQSGFKALFLFALSSSVPLYMYFFL